MCRCGIPTMCQESRTHPPPAQAWAGPGDRLGLFLDPSLSPHLPGILSVAPLSLERWYLQFENDWVPQKLCTPRKERIASFPEMVWMRLNSQVTERRPSSPIILCFRGTKLSPTFEPFTDSQLYCLANSVPAGSVITVWLVGPAMWGLKGHIKDSCSFALNACALNTYRAFFFF